MAGTVSQLDERRPRAWQNNPKFGERTGLGVDIDRPAMLLDNDVMADGEAKPGPFTGGFGRKERAEQLFPDLGGYASAVVANPDFNAVAEVLCRGSQRRFILPPICLGLALGCGVEPI